MMKTLFFVACLLVAVYADSQCDDDWETYEDHCYSFHPEALNWTDARTFCQSLKKGADLAILREANTLRSLYEYTEKYSLRGSFWLGGSDLEYEGDWVWVDSSRIQRGTPFWGITYDLLGWKMEPNGGSEQNCLEMNKKEKLFFSDEECDLENHPICMY